MRMAPIGRWLVATFAVSGFWVSAEATDLMECYRAALQMDAGYGISKAAAEASREVLPQARAQLMPSLSITGTRFRNNLTTTQPDFFGNSVTSIQNYPSNQYTISLRQPLFRMGLFEAYEQAKDQVEVADSALEKDRQDMAIHVAEAYFDALLAEDQLALIQAQKRGYAKELDGSKRAFAAGAGTRTDIDEAQAKFDLAEAQEIEAGQNVALTRRTLRSIANIPVSHLVPLDPERLRPLLAERSTLEEWWQRGEQGSPQLRTLSAQVEAARKEVAKARAGHYPTLDLVVQRDRSASDNVTAVSSTYLTNQVGLQASIPIFSGGFVDSTVRQALANLTKAREQQEDARRKLEIQIQKEYQSSVGGGVRVIALEQARRSAEQALYATRKGMQAGTRTMIDVLNAEQQHYLATRDLAEARYRLVVSRARLLNLVGALDLVEIAKLNGLLSAVRQDQAAFVQKPISDASARDIGPHRAVAVTYDPEFPDTNESK